MSARTMLLSIAAAGALVAAGAAGAGTSNPVFYVALGDSLAAGTQPAPSGEQNATRAANGTNRGYVDDLYAAERAATPNLQLRNFSCPGETTGSMRDGGSPYDTRCGYETTSQLDEALAFLQAHRGQIALVTIDIGANDVLQLGAGPGAAAISANLPAILTALRTAVGPAVPIVGMTYYDPNLAGVWLATHSLAALGDEIAAVTGFNALLGGGYAAVGAPVADVSGAFSTADTTIQSDGLPLDVERICQWTWVCSVGNIHANDAGYEEIAHTFEAALP